MGTSAPGWLADGRSPGSGFLADSLGQERGQDTLSLTDASSCTTRRAVQVRVSLARVGAS